MTVILNTIIRQMSRVKGEKLQKYTKVSRSWNLTHVCWQVLTQQTQGYCTRVLHLEKLSLQLPLSTKTWSTLFKMYNPVPLISPAVSHTQPVLPFLALAWPYILNHRLRNNTAQFSAVRVIIISECCAVNTAAPLQGLEDISGRLLLHSSVMQLQASFST